MQCGTAHDNLKRMSMPISCVLWEEPVGSTSCVMWEELVGSYELCNVEEPVGSISCVL